MPHLQHEVQAKIRISIKKACENNALLLFKMVC